MDVRPISPNVWVSDQIQVEDVGKLKDMGFRAIVCNRPDEEEAGQPAWAGIVMAADDAGMSTAYIPVKPGQVGDDQAMEFLRGPHAAPYLWRHLPDPHAMMDSVLKEFGE